MENGGLHAFKLCGFGLRWRNDRSGSKKRQIWSSCFDKSKKTGANEEGENEGETHAVTAIPIQPSFPPTQQCRYSANNKPSPPPPPNNPQRSSLNQPQSMSTTQPMLNTTFSTNQNTNQKGILQQKACRIHLKFWCHMLTCSHIYLIMQW